MDLLIQPVIGGGIILGYKYFTDNSYNKSVSKHLLSAGIGAGAIAGSSVVLGMWGDTNDWEGLAKMALKPATTAGLYTLGEKVINKNDNLLMNAVIGGATCVASGYVAPSVSALF